MIEIEKPTITKVIDEDGRDLMTTDSTADSTDLQEL